MTVSTPLFEQELVIGVDPGFSGAVAVYDPKKMKLIDVIDIPTTPKPKPEIILSKLTDFIGHYAPLSRLCVIEDVGAMPGQGVVSMFRFGFATGIVHGVVGSYMVPIFKTRPAVWKSALGLSRDKSLSIEKAKKNFPSHAHLFTKSKDGRAEAALLAQFGARIEFN